MVRIRKLQLLKIDMNEKNILIAGIGNDILMDDGIGLKLVDYLKENLSATGVSYEKANLGGLEIVELIQGYKKVIFIDAIKTRGGIPGSVYQFTPEDFKETLHLSNVHDVNFLTALKLGEQMNMEITDDIHIIAIEIIEDEVFGNDFTPPVQEKWSEIKQTVTEIIQSWIG